MANKPHWEFNRQFDEMFSAHAIRWFDEHGAFKRRMLETRLDPR